MLRAGFLRPLGAVSVLFKGESRGSVTEVLLQRFHVVSAFQGYHRICMSQVVNTGFTKTEPLDNPLETVIDRAIGQAVSNLIAENQIVLPGFLAI